MLYGFLGALIALLLLGGMIYAYGESFSLDILDGRYWPAYAVIAAVVLVAGMLICWLATLFATHRNLKRNKE